MIIASCRKRRNVLENCREKFWMLFQMFSEVQCLNDWDFIIRLKYFSCLRLFKDNTQIKLSNSKNEYVTISYDKKSQVLKFDRKHSGDVSFSKDFAFETSVKVPGGSKELRIFVDKCSIEVFDSEGKAVMTNLVFPTEKYSQLSATGCKTVIYQLVK